MRALVTAPVFIWCAVCLVFLHQFGDICPKSVRLLGIFFDSSEQNQ
jgi:hypothetical protein